MREPEQAARLVGDSCDGPAASAGVTGCAGGGTREKNAAMRAFSRCSRALFGLVAVEWSAMLEVAAGGVTDAALVERGAARVATEEVNKELEAGRDCDAVTADRSPTRFRRAAISSLLRRKQRSDVSPGCQL